jgi:hypothetical protein
VHSILVLLSWENCPPQTQPCSHKTWVITVRKRQTGILMNQGMERRVPDGWPLWEWGPLTLRLPTLIPGEGWAR